MVGEARETKSNDELITEAIAEGTFSDVIEFMETQDLGRLLEETRRGKILSDILSRPPDEIVGALKRLGWSDHVVDDLQQRSEL